MVRGGKDHPGIHSVAVHPANSRHITLAVPCGGAWISDDDGATWNNRSQGMRCDYMPPNQAYNPNVQDPHRLVQCTHHPDSLWVQHHNGIFRSVDGGARWDEISDVPPSVFGFAVAVNPREPETAWFVPTVKDECRVPVDARFVVTRTRDGGKSFDVLQEGLPTHDCYDIVFRHGLDIDPTGEQLVMGSSQGSLWISENQGDHWTCLSTHLPPIHCARWSTS